MNKDAINSIMQIVRDCDDVQLCTFGLGDYPETRHLTNAMNRDATVPILHFMTGRTTPKYEQLKNNQNCCVYYFNPSNRHAVRLFGKMEFIDDMCVRREFWRDEYAQFGYRGAGDENFALMRFHAMEYKFYIGDDLHFGKI